MSEERRKILEMLASGKIDADDAERLLEKMGTSSGTGTTSSAGATAREGQGFAQRESSSSSTNFVLLADAASKRAPMRHRLKFLRVVVKSATEETVNIRIPLAFVRTGLKLTAMLPPTAQKRLTQEGIDLSALSSLQGEELIEALRDLKIDVDSPDGETVRIFCE